MRFEIYRSDDDQYYFNLIARNHEVIDMTTDRRMKEIE